MKQTVWMLVMLAAGVAGGQQIAATGDVGANVNAAFRAASGTREKPAAAALVTIPPGTYRYATTIEIPNESGRSLGAGAGPYVYAPVLDCQGAVLNFTGTGDAVFVHGEGSLGVASTGQIRNCVIRSATPHSTTVKSLIHIASRTGFTLSTLRLENAQWCVDWENTTADGGQGFNEDDNFEHIQSQGCADHIHAHVRTGDKGATAVWSTAGSIIGIFRWRTHRAKSAGWRCMAWGCRDRGSM